MSNQRKHQISIYHRLYLEMQKCRVHLKGKLNSTLKESGVAVSFDQWLVLKEIKMTQGINQKNIAFNLSKDIASVSRILNKLSKVDLVAKELKAKNAKEHRLYLKPKGLELMASTEKQISRLFKSEFSKVHEKEINLMLDVLNRMNT